MAPKKKPAKKKAAPKKVKAPICPACVTRGEDRGRFYRDPGPVGQLKPNPNGPGLICSECGWLRRKA